VKKKRFSVEQITSVLQQAGSGVPVADVCRQVGISEQTFYRWKKTYGAMLPSEARELECMVVMTLMVRFGSLFHEPSAASLFVGFAFVRAVNPFALVINHLSDG
jgi:hypothetical protein